MSVGGDANRAANFEVGSNLTSVLYQIKPAAKAASVPRRTRLLSHIPARPGRTQIRERSVRSVRSTNNSQSAFAFRYIETKIATVAVLVEYANEVALASFMIPRLRVASFFLIRSNLVEQVLR